MYVDEDGKDQGQNGKACFLSCDEVSLSTALQSDKKQKTLRPS